MPTPETKTVYQEQQCKFDVPATRFSVGFGYKDRDCITVEFRDGDMVHLHDVRQSRYPDKWLTASFSFEIFAEEWPRFVEFMAARAESANRKEGKTECSKCER